MSTLASILNPQSATDMAISVPGGAEVTYAEFAMRLSASPNCLRARECSPAERCPSYWPNGLEFMVVFLAVARAGAIAAPLNSAYTTDEFTFYMEDAEAQLAILPLGEHAAREAAAHLGVPTVEASLDDSGRTFTIKGRRHADRSAGCTCSVTRRCGAVPAHFWNYEPS